MAEMVKKATRESFGEALTALAETNPDIVVLDADLAEATKTGIFKKKYPERFIDCGIAECNMIGIAAGLATCGKVPFAASFAMFSAGRAFEQVRNSVGYPHLNVKVVGSHAGISVGEDGALIVDNIHKPFEELSSSAGGFSDRTLLLGTVMQDYSDIKDRIGVYTGQLESQTGGTEIVSLSELCGRDSIITLSCEYQPF